MAPPPARSPRRGASAGAKAAERKARSAPIRVSTCAVSVYVKSRSAPVRVSTCLSPHLCKAPLRGAGKRPRDSVFLPSAGCRVPGVGCREPCGAHFALPGSLRGGEAPAKGARCALYFAWGSALRFGFRSVLPRSPRGTLEFVFLFCRATCGALGLLSLTRREVHRGVFDTRPGAF